MHKLSRRQTLASILAAGASAAVPSTRAAHADGTTARVSFLLVNDIYRIEEKDGRGGMARFAAVVKAERASALAENCHLICVHAGDTLSPSLLSSFDQGAHMAISSTMWGSMLSFPAIMSSTSARRFISTG